MLASRERHCLMEETQVFNRNGIVIILSGPLAHALVLGKACVTQYSFPLLFTNEDPSRCEHLEKMAIAYTAVMGHAGQEFQGGQDEGGAVFVRGKESLDCAAALLWLTLH